LSPPLDPPINTTVARLQAELQAAEFNFQETVVRAANRWDGAAALLHIAYLFVRYCMPKSQTVDLGDLLRLRQ
jgi:hypothetical protein